jgi:hypothetical protein
MDDKQLAEKLTGPDSANEILSDTDDSSDNMAVVEETFGIGANEKILLVTKGISLKKIVEASK